MTDAEQVCKALGIEPASEECTAPNNCLNPDIICDKCKYNNELYPTGLALLDAIKQKLQEHGIITITIIPRAVACEITYYVNRKYAAENLRRAQGLAPTELEAVLLACHKAFCKEAKQ